MRKILLICIISMLAQAAIAGEKITVSIVKQYTDTSFVLPSKAIEKKMNCISIANKKADFPKQLIDTLLTKFQNDDAGNNVFVVRLKYYGNGILIEACSSDILANDTTSFYGDIVVDRKHFVLIDDEISHDLLKQYFKRNSTSVIFQRLFEKTYDIETYEPSSLRALYNERSRKLEIREYIINGEECSFNVKNTNSSTSNNDDDDDTLYKLDVELFDD